MSARDSLLKYHARQLGVGKRTRTKKTNKAPEKEVEKAVMKWLSTNGFSCHVVESKAQFSASAGRFLRGATVAGMPDIIGCDSSGVGAFIELKAPGRRATLRSAQKDFLITKIRMGCFGVVVDSVYGLDDCYVKWRGLGRLDRIKFLLNMLPSKKAGTSSKQLFE